MNLLPTSKKESKIILIQVRKVNGEPEYEYSYATRVGDRIRFDKNNRLQGLEEVKNAQVILSIDDSLIIKRPTKSEVNEETVAKVVPGLDLNQYYWLQSRIDSSNLECFFVSKTILDESLKKFDPKSIILEVYLGSEHATILLEQNEKELLEQTIESVEQDQAAPILAFSFGKRGLNHPTIEANKIQLNSRKKLIHLLTRYTLPLVFLIALLRFVIFQESDQHQKLSRQLSLLEKQLEQFSGIESKESQHYSFYPLVNLIDSIAFLTPANVQLKEISLNPLLKANRRSGIMTFDPYQFRIIGITSDYQPLIDFSKELKAINRLDSIVISEVNRVPRTDLIKFNIKGGIAYEF